jgi:hypothetical protein
MQLLVEEAEKLLRSFRHPEPFRVPTAPGGKLKGVYSRKGYG